MMTVDNIADRRISYRIFDCLVVLRGCFVGWFCLTRRKSLSHFSGVSGCVFYELYHC